MNSGPSDPKPATLTIKPIPGIQRRYSHPFVVTDKFAEKVLQKLEVMNTNIGNVQQEIRVINITLTELQKVVTDSSDRLAELKDVNIPGMVNKSKESEAKLMNAITKMEIHDRKLNLLMYGLPTKPSENTAAVIRDAILKLGLTDEEARYMMLINV